ncbi:hypothetical protein HDU98_001807 [Podochytrium sp. JEL0797]|nr:hypothetical protein HDU98_001807 [Podochytrium sp. JEL0797]
MWHHLGNCSYKLPYRLTNPGTFKVDLRHAYEKFKAISEVGDEWPQPVFEALVEEGFELNVCPECPSFSAKMLEAEVNHDLPLCSRTEPQQGVYLKMTMETEREVYKFKNYGEPLGCRFDQRFEMHTNSTCHSSRNQSIGITGDSHGRVLTLALDQRLSGNTDGLYRNVKYHHIHTRYYNPEEVKEVGVEARVEYDLTRRRRRRDGEGGEEGAGSSGMERDETRQQQVILIPSIDEPVKVSETTEPDPIESYPVDIPRESHQDPPSEETELESSFPVEPDSSEIPAESDQEPIPELPPVSEPPTDPFQSLSSTEVEYNYLEHLNLLTDPSSYRNFDNFLQASQTEQTLLKYDSLVLNVGHWPASGPWAGGHFTLERYTDLLESAASFLDTIQLRRKIHGRQPLRVIWMGVYAFHINPDPTNMQAEGLDWRTNYRLKVWDVYAERVWRRREGVARLNGFEQTLAWTQESPDWAHYYATPAVEAVVDEVLHKLNVCGE